MSKEEDIRTEFAALLKTGLGIPIEPFAPGEVRTAAGYLEFGTPWWDFKDAQATFDNPGMRLQLVLVSPGVDWKRVMPWIADHVSKLRVALRPKTVVGGIVRPVITQINPAGIIGGKAFAIAVDFSPVPMGPPEEAP